MVSAGGEERELFTGEAGGTGGLGRAGGGVEEGEGRDVGVLQER